jgi:CubicO group peptidase (beta-lactamase class C family)
MCSHDRSESSNKLATGAIMINRRDVLKAMAAGGLLSHCGTVLAQSPRTAKKRKKKASPDQISAQDDARLNDVLGPIRDEYHLPGLIGAILIGNRIAASGAIGIRKIGSAQPIKFNDQMHIGSCTKAMTATMIGSLVEDGKLSWKSNFRTLFPEIADQLHPQFQEVTLSQLLTHRAGLPPDGPWWSLPGATSTENRHALLLSMSERAPLSRPGSTYVYSNVGYALAGLMAERVSGQSWETLMQRRLFDPLGMASAGFGTPGERGVVTQPWGHHQDGKNIKPTQQDNAPAMGPAATVHCSVPDWAKFAALHLAGERGDSEVLKPATLKTLHIPPPSCDYAGGWLVADRSWAGGATLNHAGSNTSWYATIWLAPARNFAILVAINQGDKQAEQASDRAASALVRVMPAFA